MKSWSPYAIVATLALHAMLAATLATVLSVDRKQDTPPEPLKVQLLQASPVTPSALAPPPAPAITQVPQKRRAEPKPRIETKPAPPPRVAVVPQSRSSDILSDAKPAPTTPSTAAPIAVTPSAPAAAPAAPARTSASDASYAASNRKPPYPRLSRSNEEQGTVVLRVLVKADGTAGAVEVKNSSGYPLLDESARSTVQSWHFKPATADGKPVAEWYQVTIPFTLQDN